MLIDLDGDIGAIAYSNGGWKMKVELRQPLPHDGKSGYPNSEPYRILGNIELHITDAHADEIIKNNITSLKLLVEAKKVEENT